mgnify:CR=1 FL=1
MNARELDLCVMSECGLSTSPHTFLRVSLTRTMMMMMTTATTTHQRHTSITECNRCSAWACESESESERETAEWRSREIERDRETRNG